MASAVLTFEVDGKNFLQSFIVWLLHQGYGFIPSRVERLYGVIFQFDFENIKIQDGFVFA